MKRKYTRNIVIGDLDRAIGLRIQELRIACGMSRQDVAKLIGITHQQVAKYESGDNRISASRLYELAQALNVHIGYFFSDTGKVAMPERKRQAIEVARNFMSIENHGHREGVAILLKFLKVNK